MEKRRRAARRRLPVPAGSRGGAPTGSAALPQGGGKVPLGHATHRAASVPMMARSATRNGVHDSGEAVEPEWPTYIVRARVCAVQESACIWLTFKMQDAMRKCSR